MAENEKDGKQRLPATNDPLIEEWSTRSRGDLVWHRLSKPPKETQFRKGQSGNPLAGRSAPTSASHSRSINVARPQGRRAADQHTRWRLR